MSHLSVLRPAHPGTQPVSATRMSENFWPVFRDLIEVRESFSLARPVLTTLRALITFMDKGAVVFASNHKICERAEGISQSTFRRHVKALIDAGFARRLDSPNGKRFALRTEGREDLIFGIDLSPLLQFTDAIAERCEEARRSALQIRHLRKALGALLFKAEELGTDVETLDAIRPVLRRKVKIETLEAAIEAVENLLEIHLSSSDLTVNDSQNDCHKNNTIKEYRKYKETEINAKLSDHEQLLRLAQKHAPEALEMVSLLPNSGPAQALDKLALWTGVPQLAINRAKASVGIVPATLALLIIVQNINNIRKPAAYFQALTSGTKRTQFIAFMLRSV